MGSHCRPYARDELRYIITFVMQGRSECACLIMEHKPVHQAGRASGGGQARLQIHQFRF